MVGMVMGVGSSWEVVVGVAVADIGGMHVVVGVRIVGEHAVGLLAGWGAASQRDDTRQSGSSELSRDHMTRRSGLPVGIW